MIWLSFVSCFCNAQSYKPGPSLVKQMKLKSITILSENKVHKLNIGMYQYTYEFDTNGYVYPHLKSLSDTTLNYEIVEILIQSKAYTFNLSEIKNDTFNKNILDTVLLIKNKQFKSIQHTRGNFIIQHVFNDSGNVILKRTYHMNTLHQEMSHNYEYYNNQGELVMEVYYSNHLFRPRICSRDRSKRDVHIAKKYEYYSNGMLHRSYTTYNKHSINRHRFTKRTYKYKFY